MRTRSTQGQIRLQQALHPENSGCGTDCQMRMRSWAWLVVWWLGVYHFKVIRGTFFRDWMILGMY